MVVNSKGILRNISKKIETKSKSEVPHVAVGAVSQLDDTNNRYNLKTSDNWEVTTTSFDIPSRLTRRRARPNDNSSNQKRISMHRVKTPSTTSSGRLSRGKEVPDQALGSDDNFEIRRQYSRDEL